MYEDTWYTAFVPRTQTPPLININAPGGARESLLGMPSGDTNTDDRSVDRSKANSNAFATGRSGPPEATIARRAKSFSDFYDVVRAHLKIEKRDDEHSRKKAERKPLDSTKTELEFLSWYDGLDEDLISASNEEYILYKESLGTTSRHLESLLKNTDASLEILTSVSNAFKTVKTQTNASRAQCEDLVTEKKKYTELEEGIAENLKYYSYLEPITRRLNAPGAGNFVRSQEFSEMLTNLDNCIEYMDRHPNHRESATYRARYKALLTTALSLIEVHFTNNLRVTAADISNRIADKQLNETTMSALLYAKFRSGASELKQVGIEIQKRAVLPQSPESTHESEYQSLMNELTQSYATIRGKLILPLVAKKMNEISLAPSTAKDLVAFARSSISYVRGVCLDEFDLWSAWFATDAGLYDFLESICEILHDHIRPRIVRETQLPKLCELCSLIKSRYLEDSDDESEDGEDDGVDDASLDFTTLIQPVLEDAQTRLVFIVMSVMRNEIESYKPEDKYLDPPARSARASFAGKGGGKAPVLSGRKNSTKSSALQQNDTALASDRENGVSEWKHNLTLAREDWYPTLAKAVWLLSRIYRLINSKVFDDLAHQIVHQTTQSLVRASGMISARSSPTDANLFLIKNFLILKEHILAFDIEFTATTASAPPDVSLDFTSVASGFWGSRERAVAAPSTSVHNTNKDSNGGSTNNNNSGSTLGLFNPLNLVHLVSTNLFPRVVSNMLDAKTELDGRLRQAINDFVDIFVERIASGIAVPGDNTSASASASPSGTVAKATPNMQKNTTGTIITTTAAKTKRAMAQGYTVKSTRPLCMAIQSTVPFLRQKVEEYVENPRTRKMLVAAVQEAVLKRYERFYAVAARDMKDEMGREKGNEDGDDDLWTPARFAEWCVDVFGVGRVGVMVAAEAERGEYGREESVGSGDDGRSGSV